MGVRGRRRHWVCRHQRTEAPYGDELPSGRQCQQVRCHLRRHGFHVRVLFLAGGARLRHRHQRRRDVRARAQPARRQAKSAKGGAEEAGYGGVRSRSIRTPTRVSLRSFVPSCAHGWQFCWGAKGFFFCFFCPPQKKKKKKKKKKS